MSPSVIALLQQARRAEKEHSLFYRALASLAERDEDAQLAEDLNGLHADEQHHLSRLSVRLVELDQPLPSLDDSTTPGGNYPDWKPIARQRELAEVVFYQGLLAHELDPQTHALIEQILVAEQLHAEALAGKYMSA